MTAVRRSAVKMWLIAIGAIPLLVLSIDVLTYRRITNWLRDIVFTPEDTQIYEPRDVIWAWALLLFSAVILLWGLKELFLPTKVVEAREEGLALKLRGPFRRHDVVPWSEVIDVTAGVLDDDRETLPALHIKFLTRGSLPDDPWGARWVDDRVLAMLAQDWSKSPDRVVAGLTDAAIEIARTDARERAGRHLRAEAEEEE